jgi:uncharacterized protein YkwD
MPTDSHGHRARLALMALLAVLALGRAQAQDTGRVLALVNQHRAANGLAPLTRAVELDSAAQRHSNDMATNNFFNHTGSDGSSAGQRITAAGYRWTRCGENIAAGYSSPDAVVTAWMNSALHRANILNANFREIGIAVGYNAGGTYRYYWTQDFGSRGTTSGGGTGGGTGGSTGGGTGGGTTPPTTGTPQIAALSPNRGPSGTTVAIQGQNFGATHGSSRVYFRRTTSTLYGGVAVASWSASRVTVQLSAPQRGSYYVWIQRGDGRVSNRLVFTLE